ncbi:MAG TPA: hypothetical protein VG055_04430 [Planctomycetaceae bacterium]|jgi:hypothetical protein|nr:hypothetical protein [Planctomycetaceae bacterium]
MKWISMASLLAIVVGGGAVVYNAAPTSPPGRHPRPETVSAADADKLAGSYDQLGGTAKVKLTLKGDGNYAAISSGCFGINWEAAGNWHLEGKTLILSAEASAADNYRN